MNRVLAITLGLFLSASVAPAQFDTGQISGFVRDASGAVIPGATVVVTNEGNGEQRTTTTNESGFYVLPNLVVGTYSASAEAKGFKKFLQRGIQLSAAQKIALDIQLQVGSMTQSVEVTAAVGLVQTETAQVSRIIESRQIQDLTLNGRNPIYLALLKPGVIGGAVGTFDPDSVSNGSFSINGGRNDEYLVYVDGAIATRTRSSGSMLGAQDIDTVQEIQVLTANYDAEYGRSSAGQIRFVTKSGTRDFHGDLVENFRNSYLDANSWTRNHSPNAEENLHPAPFRFNDYGYDIGGPVFIPHRFNTDRSKLFFFWAQEWVSRREDQTQTATVPTLAMRNGNLGELLDPKNIFFGKSRVAINPTTKQPFSGNLIDPTLIRRQGQALLNSFPLPTPGFQQGSANWIGTLHRFSDLRKDTVRFDYILNANHRIYFRATHIPWHFNEPFGGSFGRWQELWSRPNATGAITLTSSFSPTLLNEFTFSANSDGKGTIDGDPSCGAPCQRSTYGIDFPFIFPGTKLAPGKVPGISITGLSTGDFGPYPGAWAGFVYLWSDNLTKIKGNHAMKLGVALERSGQNDLIQFTTATAPATTNQNGAFRFIDGAIPNGTGLAIADALLGNFSDYSEFGAKPETPWVATALDWFIQDSWKTTRKLTLEYGVRYSLWPPWHSRWGTLSMFDPDVYDRVNAAVIDPKGGFLLSGDPFNGIVLPGCGPKPGGVERFPALATGQFTRLYRCLPSGFSNTHGNQVQPRFGWAYAFSPRTVVRGGIGLMANRMMINRDTALGGNAPFQPQVTILNGKVDNPGGGGVARVFPFTMTIQDLVLKVPVAWNWNVTFQKELPKSTAVEVAYVGTRGNHLQRKRNINQLVPGTIQANPGVNANALRPFRGFGILGISETSGSSRYDSLQVAVEKRPTTGLSFGLAYTLSKSTDNSSNLTDTLPNAYDDRGYFGLSDFDRTHVLIFHYTYQLPFLRGNTSLSRRLLGNWEISGVNQFQYGTPFSVRQNKDFAGVGPGSGNQFWNQVGDPSVQRTDFVGAGAVWFNGNAFAPPDSGTFGVQPRNGLRNPGVWLWDLGLRKNFLVRETHRLQFRFEAFDVLNHPNWGGANNNPVSSTFGLVTSKSGNRVLQLALKYSF